MNVVSKENIIENAARLAHEANKRYCESIGDMSQPTWEDAPDWQRQSAINGVKHLLENPNATPEDSHNSWLKEKQADGWKYGPVKDPQKKEHPCYLPYAELPKEQQIKDHIFLDTVRTVIAQGTIAEQEIQAKGANVAPRITPADIEANITSEFYFTAADGCFGASGHRPNSARAGTALGLLSFCVLVLRNGFTVTGESYCFNPEDFNPEVGRKIAREQAMKKTRVLMGYELRSNL